MEPPNAILGPTELRGVLAALLDLHGYTERTEGGPLLNPWQLNFARLRLTQAHYSTREKLAIFRLLLIHKQTGALDVALARRRDVNSPENRQRIIKCCESHSGYNTRDKSGNFFCVICNSGAQIYYHFGNGCLALVCSNRDCVRAIAPELDEKERGPWFINIIPQDIGTFLVESESALGTYYNVDIVEQTCTCDDFRFRHNKGHKCKHLTETNYSVFIAKAF